MDKTTLLKKLDAMLDEFDRARTFGSIEIVFRFGRASAIRRVLTEKVQNERETTRHEQHFESR
jgi:hypothetical protein